MQNYITTSERMANGLTRLKQKQPAELCTVINVCLANYRLQRTTLYIVRKIMLTMYWKDRIADEADRIVLTHLHCICRLPDR